MQTTTYKPQQQAINPFAVEDRALQQKLAEFEQLNNIPMSSKFEKLPPGQRMVLEGMIREANSEQELVAFIDDVFPGKETTMTGKDGTTHTYRGYSKLADYALEVYRENRKNKH
jgi:hypothetical protein